MPSFEQTRPSGSPSDANANQGLPLRLVQTGAGQAGAAAGMPTGGADSRQAAPQFDRSQAEFRIERFYALINDSRECAERRAENERVLDQL